MVSLVHRWARGLALAHKHEGDRGGPMGVGNPDDDPRSPRLSCALRYAELVSAPHFVTCVMLAARCELTLVSPGISSAAWSDSCTPMGGVRG